VLVKKCGSNHLSEDALDWFKTLSASSPGLISPKNPRKGAENIVNAKKTKRTTHVPRRREIDMMRYVFHPSDIPPSNNKPKFEK
jgi:hypothetical protein